MCIRDSCTTTYLSLRLPASYWFRTLSPVQAPYSCHITPILCSLHWLKITECIEYKLLSPTSKVLTTTQPLYLHHLISVQPPRSTRPSYLVTLPCPPTSFSQRITDRSFLYASPCLTCIHGLECDGGMWHKSLRMALYYSRSVWTQQHY